jgi:hypothetical protein
MSITSKVICFQGSHPIPVRTRTVVCKQKKIMRFWTYHWAKCVSRGNSLQTVTKLYRMSFIALALDSSACSGYKTIY